jgi:hypothetical protein
MVDYQPMGKYVPRNVTEYVRSINKTPLKRINTEAAKKMRIHQMADCHG